MEWGVVSNPLQADVPCETLLLIAEQENKRLSARVEELEDKLSALLEAADELIYARMDWINSGCMEFSITHTELDRFDTAVRRSKEPNP